MFELDTQPAHGRYVLRPVTDADFDFLWQLKVDTLKPYIEKLYGWDEAQSKKTLRRIMRGGHIVLVGGEPVGIVKVSVEDYFVLLDEIGLIPSQQGKGLGTQIIEDVIELADGHGMPVELQVFAMNPAVKLYERLGFEVTHYRMYREVSQNRKG